MKTKITTTGWLLPVMLAVTPAWSQPTQIRVTGAQDQIEIVRDRYGVPHIYATSESDALFGLGYVHAQDRFWEMEYQRRVASGRLAEILGPTALSADRLFRTVGMRRAATKAWANSDPIQQRVIISYVAGVNAYLTSGNPLPLEFQILGFTPERWLPEDSLMVANLVSWGLDGNWSHELLRSQIALKLGTEKAAQLMPAYTKDGPVILPNVKVQASRRSTFAGVEKLPDFGKLLQLGSQVAAMLGVGGQGLGSNN